MRRLIREEMDMRRAYWLVVLVAVCAGAAAPVSAQAADRCIAYGDVKTDFTWRLCPAGEKYERQYRYFGVWSDFYRVNSEIGACRWSASASSWVCPDRTIRCDARSCGS
jgi:hypothetical protein